MTAAPVVAHSRIVGATVFSNAAHVVRRAKPELAPGLTRVTLPDLPRHLDPARLRVRTSLGRVRFVETDDLTWQKDATEPTSHEAEVAEARRRVHTLEGEQQALQAELQIIDRVIPGAGRKGPLAKLRPEAFLAGLEALTARRRAALERLRVVELERHEAD